MTADPTPSSRRRGYGQGSLTQIEEGVWRLRVHLGTDAITGKMIQPSRRFRGSRAAAEKELVRFRTELEERSTHRTGLSARVTLNELIEQHLEASEDLAPGTRRTYRSLLDKHIARGFGKTPAAKLTAQEFRTYYRRLSQESELSDSSIWSVYSLISGAIRRAQRERGLRFDRNQLVTPRKAQRPEKQLLTDGEVAAVFGVAADLGDDWPLLLRVLCATGMRRGEAAALRWSSLDDANVLHIRTGAVDDEGGTVEKDTKTGNRRRLVLDETTAQHWRDRQSDIEVWMAANSLPFNVDLYVFSNDPARRVPRRPDLVSKKWAAIRQRAGVTDEIELRSLRNWNITVLREAGFPLEFIGRRVGHEGRGSSPLAMTASYTVSSKKQDQAMAAAVEDRLKMVLDPSA